MSPISVSTLLNDVFIECCISLFDGLGCDVEPAEPNESMLAGAPFGYIDAGTDDLELTVALRLPLSVLVLTYPIVEGVTDDTLEDWISELSNQLVGKIKRALLRYDCHLKIGLPTTLFGADINEGAHQFASWVLVDRELCECRLALEIFNPQLTLSPVSDAQDDANEGELEFF
jgi:hypothetical protein